MTEAEPGVRRMCMAVAGKPGLLASACLLIEFDRLYVSILGDSSGGTQLAVAPPGVDETALAANLVAALRVVAAAEPWPDPALLAMHVGIVRVRGEGFVGSAVDRVLGLVRSGELQDQARYPRTRQQATSPLNVRAMGASEPEQPREPAEKSPSLLAVITEPLFADLLGEGWPADGWYSKPPADVWLKRYPPLVE